MQHVDARLFSTNTPSSNARAGRRRNFAVATVLAALDPQRKKQIVPLISFLASPRFPEDTDPRNAADKVPLGTNFVQKDLRNVLQRNYVDTGPWSPALHMRAAFMPLLQEWAGSQLLAVEPSGSLAKGTAVRSGTDIDHFISLAHNTTQTLQEIHNSLIDRLKARGFTPHRQTMSIGLRAQNNGTYFDVDFVPAKMILQSWATPAR